MIHPIGSISHLEMAHFTVRIIVSRAAGNVRTPKAPSIYCSCNTDTPGARIVGSGVIDTLDQFTLSFSHIAVYKPKKVGRFSSMKPVKRDCGVSKFPLPFSFLKGEQTDFYIFVYYSSRKKDKSSFQEMTLNIFRREVCNVEN